MKHVSQNKIYETAAHYQNAKQPWHFHLLTPDCRLNNSTQFALILENTQTHEMLVNYSEKPYLDIGQNLVQLLHGETVIQTDTATLPPPSAPVAAMLVKAQELSQKGIFWHHHLLFPHCQYNTHPGQWVLTFEDPRSREILESVTDKEPKTDLKHIEALFYAQTHRE